MADSFDWKAGEIIVPRQDPIAVHINDDGDCIVIRQQDPLGDKDHVILLPLTSVTQVVKAVRNAAAKAKPTASSVDPY